MKENKYDDEIFFQKYSEMPRSIGGLGAAGEWATLKPLLPDFHGKDVLDIGCGFGWHAAYASDNGANSVVATDISNKMLSKAKKMNMRDNIDYINLAFEDSVFEPNHFDVVICSLMLHYLKSFDDFLDKVYRWLRPEGILAFTVEHPIFTAEGSQCWSYDKDGNILHFPVDNYFYGGQRDAIFLGEHVVKYHRTLTTYLNNTIKKGFCLLNIVEPMPTEEMLKSNPQMSVELRRPMMLIVIAKKNGEYS